MCSSSLSNPSDIKYLNLVPRWLTATTFRASDSKARASYSMLVQQSKI